jgi:hypothetical protein
MPSASGLPCTHSHESKSTGRRRPVGVATSRTDLSACTPTWTSPGQRTRLKRIPRLTKPPKSMVLVGALSNPGLQDLFQSLTSPRRKQRRRRPESEGPQPDGRRKFGSVSSAIVQILREAQSELGVREIRGEVDRLLGEAVSQHSIKSYLHRRTYGSKPIFERVSHGRYRLRGESSRIGRQ